LQAAVLRGLAVEPSDRWPNMEALLSALERGQVRRGARMGLAATGAIGLAIGAGVIVHGLDVRRRTSACAEAGADIDAVWNEQRRTHLRDALAAGGTVQATTTAQKVIPWIDDQAQAWQNARTEACIDHDVREVWDGDTLARSLWCLDERRMELESLVDELVRADVAFAVSAAARLTSVDGCRDRDVLARLPPPPTEHVEDIRAIRAQLARATAHERTGEYADALVLADSTREDAEALGWPPLVAAAWTQEAILREREGDYEEAARLATRAYFEAARVDAWDEAARAASELIYVVGYRLARFDEGRIWAEHTAIALAHTGDPGQLQEAARSHRLALVEFASGDFAQARMLHERGLELQQDALGPDHPGLAGGLANLANVHARMNVHAQARALHERALAIREQALGPVHHAVATSLNDLAAVYFSAGEHAAARPLFERSLAIDVAVLGPDHPDVAVSLMNVGIVHIESDEADEAKALFEQALAIFEKSLGPDHPNVASCLVNLASVHARRGEHGRARAALERALAIQEKSLGPDHVDLARSFGGLAEVHAAAGEIEQALARGKQALALREDALGSDHPDVAATLVGVAENLLAVGDADAATRALERAMAIYERHEGVQQGEPEAQRMLAKARARVRGERQRSPK
jgi:tetratricopeptide (TPR) repeat protein